MDNQVLDSEVKSLTLGQLFESLKGKTEKKDEQKTKEQKLSDAAKWVRKIWANNGFETSEEQYDKSKISEKITYQDLCQAKQFLGDMVTTSDIPMLIGKVVNEIVREGVEPVLIGESLLQRINFNAAPQITFPATGAIVASDVAEGEEYPEQAMSQAGQCTCTIGKVGLKIRMTEETIRYSRYDVMSMHIRAAGRAMRRHKEKKIWDHISAQGVVSFDNSGAGGADQTTGRDINGNFNGTFCLDDLMKMYADCVARGFIPNILVVHPLAWTILAKEPTLRAWAFAQGGPIWMNRQGQPGLVNQPGAPMGSYNYNANQATTYANVPGIFPEALRLVVTPFVSYDATTYNVGPVTDIIMADSNEMGILVVDEELATDEWNDPARDIRAIKFRERYGIAVTNEGQAISLAKNIVIADSFNYRDKLEWDIQAGALPSGAFSLA